MELGPLRAAESTFYRVGVPIEEARQVVSEQVASLEQMVRLIAARIAAVVLAEPRVLRNRAYVEGLDPGDLSFDPAAMAERWAACSGTDEEYPWPFDPSVLDRFDVSATEEPEPVSAG